MKLEVKSISWLWFAWFMATVAVVGASLAYGAVLPLSWLGRVWKPSARAADAVMRWGIGLLMRLQPWLTGEFALDPPGGGKGCLLVSNHRSHLDAFILLSRIPGIRILAKSSLFHVPFLGTMMRASRQIPIERGNVASFAAAMERVEREVGRGEAVHVFAEMTRCPEGFQGTQDFALAPFHAAKRGGFPVVPVVFQGTDAVWPRGALGLRFRKPVRAVALPALDPAQFASAGELMKETRRRIEAALGGFEGAPA